MLDESEPEILVGFAIFDTSKPNSTFVLELQVDKDVKRCGMGRSLLNNGGGGEALELQVHVPNTEAISFYKANGFTAPLWAPACDIITLKRKAGVK